MSKNVQDDRLKREPDAGRASRRSQDRVVTEDRVVTDDDRLEMFRQALFNDALPDLPNIPGYHTIWLTTTNPRDPIHRRMQLGYEPVKPEEVRGMEYATVKTGEWAGMIGVNEMLAFKLPLSLYNKFMQEAHHDAPLREEQGLRQAMDSLKEQADRQGGVITEFEGNQEVGRSHPKAGIFQQ